MKHPDTIRYPGEETPMQMQGGKGLWGHNAPRQIVSGTIRTHKPELKRKIELRIFRKN
jgi:hypothetical protein